MTSPAEEIPIIVVAYQKPEQLEKCLAAIAVQTIPVRPWVHDNSQENLYYTKAANLGFREALASDATYAMAVGQDCYLAPDAAAQLVVFMNEHPRCAIAGAQQRNPADPDIVVHAGGLAAFPRGIHAHGRASENFGQTRRKVPWVNGSCIMVRLAAAMEFGLLDENMRLLGCDADWCYTARARGWEVWYCADAICFHEGGVSSQKTSEAVSAIFQADMEYFRDKWISGLFGKLEREFPLHPNPAGGVFWNRYAPPTGMG
jgi:GT2 family glycosyltransferase